MECLDGDVKFLGLKKEKVYWQLDRSVSRGDYNLGKHLTCTSTGIQSCDDDYDNDDDDYNN